MLIDKFFIITSIIFLLATNVCSSQDMKVAVLVQNAFEKDGYKDMNLFKKSESIYLDLLKNDTSSFVKNYNLGSLYCNYSSYLTDCYILSKKNNHSFLTKIKLNHKRTKYYKKGLFYMERANRIRKSTKTIESH